MQHSRSHYLIGGLSVFTVFRAICAKGNALDRIVTIYACFLTRLVQILSPLFRTKMYSVYLSIAVKIEEIVACYSMNSHVQPCSAVLNTQEQCGRGGCKS